MRCDIQNPKYKAHMTRRTSRSQYQDPLLLTSGTLGAGLRTTFSSQTFSLMRTQATLREPSSALGLNPREWPSGDSSSRVCRAGFRW